MKVMLRCDQDRVYLDKADEIYVPYKRKDIIEEVHAQYPNKSILLDISSLLTISEEEKNEVKMLSGLCKGKLKILVSFDFFKDVPTVQRVLSYPMHSLYEMKIARSNGIREFYIGAELMHNLSKLEKFKIDNDCIFRLTVNSIDDKEMIDDNSLLYLSSYIVPQEVKYIENIIDYIDFKSELNKQESALYRIYVEDREWAGPLKLLVPELDDCKAYVRLMEPNAMKFGCNMGCLCGSSCRYCIRNIELADPSVYANIKKPEDLEKGEEGETE